MEDQNIFFYPKDMKRKAVFFGWTGINLAILAVSMLFAIFVFFASFIWLPVVLSLLYGILTFTVEDRNMLDYIRQYINYLFLDQLVYFWGTWLEEKEA